jgi:hypothetical protein
MSAAYEATREAFYDLAIKERDYERTRVDRLTAELAIERERLAAVRALLDPDAEMATWVVGHRYFEEADIRRALDGEQP